MFVLGLLHQLLYSAFICFCGVLLPLTVKAKYSIHKQQRVLYRRQSPLSLMEIRDRC